MEKCQVKNEKCHIHSSKDDKKMCMPTRVLFTTTQAWDFSQCNTTLYTHTADADISTAMSAQLTVNVIDREFVTSAKKIANILTNFPKLKKFVKICTKIR